MTKPVMREQEKAQRAMARPHVAMHNNFVGADDSIDDYGVSHDPSDPASVMRQARQKPQVKQSPQKAAPSASVNEAAINVSSKTLEQSQIEDPLAQ